VKFAGRWFEATRGEFDKLEVVSLDASDYVRSANEMLSPTILAGEIYDVSTQIASDERLKQNIAPASIDWGELIDRVEVVEFDWTEYGQKPSLGFTLQQLESISGALTLDITRLIRDGYQLPGGDGTIYKTFDVEGIIAALIQSVQEKRQRIADLTQLVADLEARIDGQDAQIRQNEFDIVAVRNWACDNFTGAKKPPWCP
jgi:hypothetical protein